MRPLQAAAFAAQTAVLGQELAQPSSVWSVLHSRDAQLCTQRKQLAHHRKNICCLVMLNRCFER